MMKFITEEYLRDLYRKEPFDTFQLQQGQRLTPGAVQYLSDKRIKQCSNDLEVKKIVSKDEEIQKNENVASNVISKESNLNLKKLSHKLKTVEAEFFITSSEIVNTDIFLGQNIMILGRKIANIRDVVNGRKDLETIYCKECSGMKISNLKEELNDCFEITDFHIQLKNSSTILKLHMLRCISQELQVEINDAYFDDHLKKRIIENMNSLINTLSQFICSAVGGKECQRKEQTSKDVIT